MYELRESGEKMTEPTFAEKFPKLTIKEQQQIRLEDLRYTRWTMGQLLKDIEKHCLSRSRVREAIEKVFSGKRSWPATKRKIALLKELGLENDVN